MVTGRCDSCGAVIPTGADWCSLCLAPTVPPQPSRSSETGGRDITLPPTTPPVIPAPDIDSTTNSVPPAAVPAGPPTTPPVAPPGSEPAGVDHDAWVALLAEQERRSAPSLLAGPQSRGRRVAIMVGGAVAVIALLVIAMGLLSLVMG